MDLTIFNKALDIWIFLQTYMEVNECWLINVEQFNVLILFFMRELMIHLVSSNSESLKFGIPWNSDFFWVSKISIQLPIFGFWSLRHDNISHVRQFVGYSKLINERCPFTQQTSFTSLMWTASLWFHIIVTLFTANFGDLLAVNRPLLLCIIMALFTTNCWDLLAVNNLYVTSYNYGLVHSKLWWLFGCK